MTVGRILAVAAACLLLGLVAVGMFAASEGPVQLGPYTTGDGDNVVITPRVAP